MKPLFVLLILSSALPSYAQIGRVSVRSNDAYLRVSGEGRWVCHSHSVFSGSRPTVSRSVSQAEAKIAAFNDCSTEIQSRAYPGAHIDTKLACRETECELDPSGNTKVNVSINRGNNRIDIKTSEDPSYVCKTGLPGNSDMVYYAHADTKIEAKVLASNLCLNELGQISGGDSFCEVSDASCEKVRGRSSKISIPNPFARRAQVNDSDRNQREDRPSSFSIFGTRSSGKSQARED